MSIREQARRLHQVSKGQLTGDTFVTEAAVYGSKGLVAPIAWDVAEAPRDAHVEVKDGLRIADSRRIHRIGPSDVPTAEP